MSTLVVVQARMGSKRLPNKVLLPLAGAPLLERLIQRILSAKSDFSVMVATGSEKADEPIRELCRTIDVKCFSGSSTDILDRTFQATCEAKAEILVRIPASCPLIDPDIIDRVLEFYSGSEGAYDYVSNLHPPTYPDGNDVEVLSLPTLAAAWEEAVRPVERELITPFILDQPERFRIGNVEWQSGLNYASSHRWRVEGPEDYAFVSEIYGELWSVRRPGFSLQDILELLDRRPDLSGRNARRTGRG